MLWHDKITSSIHFCQPKALRGTKKLFIELLPKEVCITDIHFSPLSLTILITLLWGLVKGKVNVWEDSLFISWTSHTSWLPDLTGPLRLWQVTNSLIVFTHVSFSLISQRERELFSHKLTMQLDTMEMGQHFERKKRLENYDNLFQKN